MKTAALSIRIPADMKIGLDKAALDDGRSTASLVNKILSDWLATNRTNIGKTETPKRRV